MRPKIKFEVNKSLNKFCHISVLYTSLPPSELSEGMLGNKAYQEKHTSKKQDPDLDSDWNSESLSTESWYGLARDLMRGLEPGEATASLRPDNPLRVFVEMLQRDDDGFDEIWKETRPRLEQYCERFAVEWTMIGDRVLSRLSELTGREWAVEEIRVHFVDCLWGGFAWKDCIGFAPLPDIQVQKKFIAHELSELITPSAMVARRLWEAGLDPEISHTITDLIAFYSVREILPKTVLEKKGVRPNPNYYHAVNELEPMFERYAQNPPVYKSLDDFVLDITQKLKAKNRVPVAS